MPGANSINRKHLARVTYPDGRIDKYTWDTGTYAKAFTNGAPSPGTFSGSGTDIRTTIEHEGPSGPVDGKSTKEVIIKNETGQVYLHATYAYDNGYSSVPVEWVVYDYDARSRRTDEGRSNNTHIVTDYSSCCQASSITDASGIVTEFEYDALGRLEKRIKKGVAQDGSDDIVTEIARTGNSTGLLVTETVRDGSSTLTLTSTKQYNDAGRLVQETDPAGVTTSYAHSVTTAGGKKVTATIDGTTIATIREYWLDGQHKKETGTGVIHHYHDYGRNTDGTRWSKVYTGHASGSSVESSPQWVEVTTNPLGQVIQERRPGHDGSILVTLHAYDSDTGRRIKTAIEDDQSNPLQAATLYEYDDLGNLLRSGLDADGTEGLQLASQKDRIQKTLTVYEKIGNDWWQVTESWTYPVAGSDDESNRTVQRRRLTGFSTNVTQEAVVIDANGNATTTIVTVDRSEKEVTTTVQYPDSTDEVRVVENGLLTSYTSRTGLETTYAYDELGRQTGVTDPRTGTSQTKYNGLGQVEWVEDAAENRTSHAYDPDTGRLVSITDADNETQYFSYNDRGDQTRVWGNTYPVEYVYDGFGRRKEMRTFQGGSGWDQSTWPASPGTADVTTWVFEDATGLLLEKRHADYDLYEDEPKWVYTYTTDGKLATRTWARDGGIVTTYSYDADTGDMTGVAYSDATPGVTYTYDRAGRQKTVTDVVGTRTLAYNSDMTLDTEDIDGSSGGLYSKLITRTYENGTVVGRPAGFQVGTVQAPGADYEVTYHYDAAGRIERITGPGLPAHGVMYSRLADSELVEYTRYQSDASTTLAEIRRAYEAQRDLIDYVQNDTSTLVSKYDYENDDLGRRTSVVYSGTAFGQDHLFKWGYNFRSELLTAARHQGTDPDDPGQQYGTNGDFVYVYDNIGNRESFKLDGADPATTYATNEVNQYTGTSDPTESFSHDEDGNLTADGQFTYTWDAENRLIAVTPTSPVNGNKKVTFAYDYMSRRVRKQVFIYASGWPGTPAEDLRFVYDQWNVVLVLDDSEAVLRKHTWGLDLSGQYGNPTVDGIHGAGGIGGLLAVEDVAAGGGSSHSYWFFYDANGNVGQLVKASDRSLAAHYEYDPYGKVITETGAYASANPFRFSTKWFDEETGLGYWGYRYYSPRLGRWMNRDPIEEQGGLLLYLAMRNNAIMYVDPQGKVPIALPIIGGVSAVVIAKGVAAGFGVTLFVCMTIPECRAAVEKALADAARDAGRAISRACRRQEKKCNPCIPPAGTKAIKRTDSTGKPHGGIPTPHSHIVQVNQSPYPECKCYWNNASPSVEPGTPPYPPKTPIAGGGPAN